MQLRARMQHSCLRRMSNYMHGDGACGKPSESTEIQREWKKIVRDSRGNVALIDFNGAPAATTNCFQTAEGRLL